MAKKKIDMCNGPLFSGIIRHTVPIILTSILQLLFNAADLVVVGRFCGSVSVAAVGATGSLTNLIVNLFIGLSVGCGVSVAQAIGARDDEATHRTVHTAIPSAIVSGVVLTVIGVSLSETFLGWMGTPQNVLELSAVYMKLYFCGMTFNMVYNFGASILRAAGDTKGPLLYLSCAGVINVILNVIFVTQFNMNVGGVALATAVSQGISAVLVIMALMRRTDACRFSFKKMHFYSAQLKKMLTIGIPAGIQGSLFSISNVIIQSSINSFGDVLMSGNAAAGNIEGFVYVLMNAFHQSALNFTGQNVGAMNYKRVKKTLLICLGCVTIAGLAAGGTVYLLGEQLLSIYITDSPQAIAYGMTRLSLICLPYFLCGLMDTTTGAIRGMGVSLSPMVITILGVCVFRIGWVYTIFQVPQFHTPSCLYISYTVSWSITFLIELIAFFMIYKKRTKMIKAD
ncbi:MAG: MATE family efflux transporter [Clostridia bacterium]|nr:MATE family efflux transporter [Clostridia bacterium]